MADTADAYDDAQDTTGGHVGAPVASLRSGGPTRSVEPVAAEIDRRLRPATVLDVGCGPGLLVEALHRRGIEARGFDASEPAISRVDGSVREAVWVASVLEPISGTYDLLTCFDVLEHVPADEVGAVIDNLTSVTDAILVSSAPGDRDEPGDRNVRPPEHWAELFAGRGFFHDVAFDADFVSPWAALYRRTPEPSVPQIVREYERECDRLRAERDRLRLALRDAEARADGNTNHQHAVDELRHDLRVAIDAVHGAEAARASAVGEARRLHYELAVAKEREREFVDLVAKIDEDAVAAQQEWDEVRNSRSFRLYWKVLGLYRRLRP